MLKIGATYEISDVIRTDRFRIPAYPFNRIAYSHITDYYTAERGFRTVAAYDPYETDPQRVVLVRNNPTLFTDELNLVARNIIDTFRRSNPFIAWYAEDGTIFCGYSELVGWEPYEEVLAGQPGATITETNTPFYGRMSIAAKRPSGSFPAEFAPDLSVASMNSGRDPEINFLYRMLVDLRSPLSGARGHVISSGYIITTPGRTDSDGVVQRNPMVDSSADASNYPNLTEHKGSARVESVYYQGMSPNEGLGNVNRLSTRFQFDQTSGAVNQNSPASIQNSIGAQYSRKFIRVLVNKMDNDILLNRGSFEINGEQFFIGAVDSSLKTGELNLTAYRDLTDFER